MWDIASNLAWLSSNGTNMELLKIRVQYILAQRAKFYFKKNRFEPFGDNLAYFEATSATFVPDPPGKCHLTVKKLPKTWHLKKKNCQKFLFFEQMKIFGNFLTVKLQFSRGSGLNTHQIIAILNALYTSIICCCKIIMSSSFSKLRLYWTANDHSLRVGDTIWQVLSPSVFTIL